jgi:biotin synthase-related radical SAM superfamily protein
VGFFLPTVTETQWHWLLDTAILLLRAIVYFVFTKGDVVIGVPKTNTLGRASISGVCHEGLTVKTRDGQPARLAVLDEHGNILEEGPEVAAEVWNVTLAVYKNFLIGKGHIRVFSQPPGQALTQNESAAA